MTPLIVLLTATRWASATSLLGSFSSTSGRSPTTNARGLLTPHLLTTRTSCRPSGVSAAMVTLNLLLTGWLGWSGGGGGALGSGAGGGTNSPLRPAWLKSSCWASSRSGPVTVISTTLPALPPGGVTVVRRGAGSPLLSGGGCRAAAAAAQQPPPLSSGLPAPHGAVTAARSHRMGESPLIRCGAWRRLTSAAGARAG